ncbi:MAG: hypothetical protein IPL32_01925 [Chloracidobacterium sp.]|nr:hypothetical protein [Chloracidobacterium sp.]
MNSGVSAGNGRRKKSKIAAAQPQKLRDMNTERQSLSAHRRAKPESFSPVAGGAVGEGFGAAGDRSEK